MMLLSHALVDGGLTITQRTNANPSNSFSFGVIHASLGELKFDGVPLHFLQVLYFFSNPMSLYYIMYFATSAYASFRCYPMYVLCLVDLITHFQTMQFIMSAITRNWQKLIAALFFAFIIIWIFGMFSYFNDSLRGHYTLGDHMDRRSLYYYIMTHWDYGMREAPSFDADFYGAPFGKFEIAWFFNTSYNLLVILVLTAIISGIIIDTFSEMRGESDAIRADMENVCFVCNIKRDEFETSFVSYSNHVEKEHRPEDYLFFRIYLDEKDPNEYTGQEQWVHKCIEAKSISFFPPQEGDVPPLEEEEAATTSAQLLAQFEAAMRRQQRIAEQQLSAAVSELKESLQTSLAAASEGGSTARSTTAIGWRPGA